MTACVFVDVVEPRSPPEVNILTNCGVQYAENSCPDPEIPSQIV